MKVAYFSKITCHYLIWSCLKCRFCITISYSCHVPIVGDMRLENTKVR